MVEFYYLLGKTYVLVFIKWIFWICLIFWTCLDRESATVRMSNEFRKLMKSLLISYPSYALAEWRAFRQCSTKIFLRSRHFLASPKDEKRENPALRPGHYLQYYISIYQFQTYYVSTLTFCLKAIELVVRVNGFFIGSFFE